MLEKRYELILQVSERMAGRLLEAAHEEDEVWDEERWDRFTESVMKEVREMGWKK